MSSMQLRDVSLVRAQATCPEDQGAAPEVSHPALGRRCKPGSRKRKALAAQRTLGTEGLQLLGGDAGSHHDSADGSGSGGDVASRDSRPVKGSGGFESGGDGRCLREAASPLAQEEVVVRFGHVNGEGLSGTSQGGQESEGGGPFFHDVPADVSELGGDVALGDSRPANLKSQISDLKYQISSIRSQISDLNSQMSNLRYKISNILSQISDCKSQISNIRSQISTLNPQISHLKSKISNIKSQISDLKSQI